MAEFWEFNFQEKQEMWGLQPTGAALSTAAFFNQHQLKKILIPGIGYGRNAQAFLDHGCQVTGIEISETAIALAQKHFGNKINIYHGPANAMPYDTESYNGIFCYALIHLLEVEERKKLIEDCFHQLVPGGYMVFVAISTRTPTYGEGKLVAPGRYETKHGVKLFYYDSEAVQSEFGNYGLEEAVEIQEPPKSRGLKSGQVFWQIRCKKT